MIELVTKLSMMANKTSYVNISPGRWVLQKKSSNSHVLLMSSFVTSCVAYSIRFAVARGKEGIIDFVRGSELKVAKGKRGHLLVVSQQLFWCHVGNLQGGFLFSFWYEKHFNQLTVFNLISLCRLRHGSTPHEEAETRLTVILLANWRIATCLSDCSWQDDTTSIHKHTQQKEVSILSHVCCHYYRNVFNVAIITKIIILKKLGNHNTAIPVSNAPSLYCQSYINIFIYQI